MNTKCVLMTMAAAMGLFACPVTGADHSKMQESHRLQTIKAAEAVEPGDVVMIACPKCKTMAYSVAEADKAGQLSSKPWLKTAKSTAAEGQLRTSCEACGSDTFCCVIKKKDLEPKHSQ